MLVIAGSAASAFGIVWYLGTRPAKPVREAQVLTARKALPSVSVKSEKLVQPVRTVPMPTGRTLADVVGVETNALELVGADSDEALLNEVVEQLLNELSAAMQSGDAKRILEIIGKLKSIAYGARSSRYGRGGGAVSLKHRILDALALAGPLGVGEVIDFLGDSEPVIAQTATDLLFKSLQDISIGDRVRAEIVVAAAEEMTDENRILRLYQEFIKMRHSVGVEALMAISTSGTAEAKAQLSKLISTFTRDISITDVSQLEAWLAENPDSNRDEWFYGPRGVQPLEK